MTDDRKSRCFVKQAPRCPGRRCDREPEPQLRLVHEPSDRLHACEDVVDGVDVRRKLHVDDQLVGAQGFRLRDIALDLLHGAGEVRAAGQIVCTSVVRELVAGKGYLFSEREPAALKGIEEPVRLFTLDTTDWHDRRIVRVELR